MADYPSHNIALASERTPEPDTIDDFGQGGTMHSRTLHDQIYYRFSVIHYLTLAEFSALEALYDAGPRADLTNFNWYIASPIVSYTVKFTARPRVVGNLGGDNFRVLVQLRGTAD